MSQKANYLEFKSLDGDNNNNNENYPLQLDDFQNTKQDQKNKIVIDTSDKRSLLPRRLNIEMNDSNEVFVDKSIHTNSKNESNIPKLKMEVTNNAVSKMKLSDLQKMVENFKFGGVEKFVLSNSATTTGSANDANLLTLPLNLEKGFNFQSNNQEPSQKNAMLPSSIMNAPNTITSLPPTRNSIQTRIIQREEKTRPEYYEMSLTKMISIFLIYIPQVFHLEVQDFLNTNNAFKNKKDLSLDQKNKLDELLNIRNPNFKPAEYTSSIKTIQTFCDTLKVPANATSNFESDIEVIKKLESAANEIVYFFENEIEQSKKNRNENASAQKFNKNNGSNNNEKISHGGEESNDPGLETIEHFVGGVSGEGYKNYKPYQIPTSGNQSYQTTVKYIIEAMKSIIQSRIEYYDHTLNTFNKFLLLFESFVHAAFQLKKIIIKHFSNSVGTLFHFYDKTMENLRMKFLEEDKAVKAEAKELKNTISNLLSHYQNPLIKIFSEKLEESEYFETRIYRMLEELVRILDSQKKVDSSNFKTDLQEKLDKAMERYQYLKKIVSEQGETPETTALIEEMAEEFKALEKTVYGSFDISTEFEQTMKQKIQDHMDKRDKTIGLKTRLETVIVNKTLDYSILEKDQYVSEFINSFEQLKSNFNKDEQEIKTQKNAKTISIKEKLNIANEALGRTKEFLKNYKNAESLQKNVESFWEIQIRVDEKYKSVYSEKMRMKMSSFFEKLFNFITK